jgi:hypothetical protein
VSGADLLQQAIEAHGGAERFRSAAEIVARLRVGGAAFTMRFKRGALTGFEGRVSTTEPRAVLSPYPQPGQRGVLERDTVRIETDSGDVVAERSNPRAAFRHFRRKIWWDDLDLLYFASYALWNYLSTPFMFLRPGFEISEIEPWRENGDSWRRLRVRFPDDVPTHSSEQDFYFDSEGKLRRLDYTAEVFGGWAKAVHYCWEHKRFSGLLVPTRRKVFPRKRNNLPRSRPTIVWIELDHAELV